MSERCETRSGPWQCKFDLNHEGACEAQAPEYDGKRSKPPPSTPREGQCEHGAPLRACATCKLLAKVERHGIAIAALQAVIDRKPLLQRSGETISEPIDLDMLMRRVAALESRASATYATKQDIAEHLGPSLGEQIRRGFARGDVLVAISDHDELRWERKP